MIFSKEKWNNSEEISAFIPSSASLGYDKMKSSLQSAETMFITKLIGEELTNKIDLFYENGVNDNKELWTKLLSLSQRAVAYLAMWYDFDALNLRITDQGFQRQESDTFKGAYKYQEENMKRTFKNRGFNCLDDILEFLDLNRTVFTDYINSPAYIDSQKSIVRSTSEVNNIIYINNSRIIFLRMRCEFNAIEENFIKPKLGDDLYKMLIDSLADSSKFTAGDKTILEGLRLACAKVVIRGAAIRLIKSTGSMTDRGLYFEQTKSGSYTDNDVSKATDMEIGDRLSQLESDFNFALVALVRYIQLNLSDYYEGSSQYRFSRDNDDKKIFWA
jgi:hypothetical protein